MKFAFILIFTFLGSLIASAKIDRRGLLNRNNPHITNIDTLASLSVGNGEFAFTCDVTGLQTFHKEYRNGVPLGTMAQWGWHSFPNPKGFRAEEVLSAFNFGRDRDEWYSCQFKTGRQKEASDYLRSNPHRLHLGIIAFEGIQQEHLSQIDQSLHLLDGVITSDYLCQGRPMHVRTTCDPIRDMVVAQITDEARHNVVLRFPYPTGQHSDDACDWEKNNLHKVVIVKQEENQIIAKHTLDQQSYYIRIAWEGAEKPVLGTNIIRIRPKSKEWNLAVEFAQDLGKLSGQHNTTEARQSAKASKAFWNKYWMEGAMVDFSHCTDPRAMELERRVVLSQYLLAIQCAGSTPPQETGLTYNSWFGKFHLEMIWWHQAQFAVWGHPEMLERTLPWYLTAQKKAHEIAQRQGFAGLRWMKMTDPSAEEAPSNVGSFLIWQQPHLIYLCELVYRATHNPDFLSKYAELVEQTATFMASFATYDKTRRRYTLQGCIPAQETLKAAETINPPFELSYWHFGLSLAQQWRERLGISRSAEWDDIIDKLSPLAEKDGVYAASETADSYLSESGKSNTSLYSDHMAVLAALGVLPSSPQTDKSIMTQTLHWVMDNWNWEKTWGWDYPTTCMNATRLFEPDIAIDALLMDKRTNTYLPNGHNYQDKRLRCYLPGNGGLLMAVALMCAGWDNCSTPLPGFPKNGKWNVKFEGLLPLP